MTAGGGGRRLPACAPTPNCVCSDDPPGPRHVAPLRLRPRAGAASPGPREAAAARAAIEEVVRSLPRCRIVEVAADRVAAEIRTRWFGFVDDLLLEVRPESGSIAVRSSSRTGYWDLGVNRRRVEGLRSVLRERGIVE